MTQSRRCAAAYLPQPARSSPFDVSFDLASDDWSNDMPMPRNAQSA
jgi:hypothetical protein